MSILKKFICLIAIGLIFGQIVVSQEYAYNVKNYITTSGRETLLTGELQSLIDQCHDAGGGTIYFPPGDYLTGTLFLKSNVYLKFSPGATLFGSKDIGDYPHDGMKSLIYANGQDNLGIGGNGTVNAQGDAFWRGKEQPYISSTPVNTVTPFLYLEGPETKKVYVQNNNFTYLDVVFDHDELFNIEELKEFNNIEPGR